MASSNPEKASVNASTIHCRPLISACNCTAIDGSATFTSVLSSTTRSSARQMATSAAAFARCDSPVAVRPDPRLAIETVIRHLLTKPIGLPARSE